MQMLPPKSLGKVLAQLSANEADLGKVRRLRNKVLKFGVKSSVVGDVFVD